jgi:diphthine synthase
MLTFIGLGLYDEKDVSLRGLEVIRSADRVYIECYTSILAGTDLGKLEALYGRKIYPLKREDIEVNPAWMEDASEKDIVLLTGGDAMVSTTHIDLRLRAAKLGIPTRIIHGASIISAVCGLTGLQNYRFGKSTTIPHPYTRGEKTIVSHTPYDTIKLNQQNNLHTLLFLDIDKNKGYMSINRGVELLLQVEEERGEEVLSDCLGVGVARAGAPEPVVRADYLENLKKVDFGAPLHILCIPAKLHFIEAEALIHFAGAPEDILVEEQ